MRTLCGEHNAHLHLLEKKIGVSVYVRGNVWLSNKQRAEVQEKIDSLLGEKTEYSIYLYG
jgi:phosphate starvation-inducible protein PhoH